MSTTIRHRSGGYFTMPNRWVDAGYMQSAPGSVTQVYLFLCRWANNTTLQSSQPMRLIAQKCGISEDVARRAVRKLEAWGVMTRDPGTGRGAKNVWILNDLPEEAPEYPDKTPPKQSKGGSEKSGGLPPQQNRGPYQPREIRDTEVSVSQPEDDAPQQITDRELADDQKLIAVWSEMCNGGAHPVKYDVARRKARVLVRAGFDEDETRELIEWLRKQSWITGGITLNLMESQADSFRASKSGDSKVRRFVV